MDKLQETETYFLCLSCFTSTDDDSKDCPDCIAETAFIYSWFFHLFRILNNVKYSSEYLCWTPLNQPSVWRIYMIMTKMGCMALTLAICACYL